MGPDSAPVHERQRGCAQGPSYAISSIRRSARRGFPLAHRPSGEPDLSEHRLGGVDAVEQACRTSSGVNPSNVSG
jgi:hypothetical protein